MVLNFNPTLFISSDDALLVRATSQNFKKNMD